MYLASIYADSDNPPTAPLPFTFLMDNLNTFEPEIDGIITADSPAQSFRVPDRGLGADYLGIYQIDGVTGDVITLTGGQGMITIISSDALEAERLISAYDYIDSPQRTVYQLRGAAPYYLKMESALESTMQIENGNTLSLDAGSIQVGETVSGTTERLSRLTYMLEVTEPQTATVRLLSDGGIIDFYTYRNNLVWLENLASSENMVGAVELYQPGTYPLEFSVSGDYILSVEEGNSLVTPVQAIELGSTVEGDTSGEVQVVEYLLDVPEATMVTLRLHQNPTPMVYNQIGISDADGNVLYRNYDLLEREEAGLGASILVRVLTLLGPSPYTVRVEVQGAYRFSAEMGDTLAADLGSLAIGQTVEVETPRSLSASAYYTLTDVEAGTHLLIVEDTSQSDSWADSVNPRLVSVNHILTEPGLTSDISHVTEEQHGTTLNARGEPPYQLSLEYSDRTGGNTIVFAVIDLDTTLPVALTIDSNNLSRGPGSNYGLLRQIPVSIPK